MSEKAKLSMQARRAFLGKLGLASRTQAALWAVEHKVAESPKA